MRCEDCMRYWCCRKLTYGGCGNAVQDGLSNLDVLAIRHKLVMFSHAEAESKWYADSYNKGEILAKK